MPKTLLKDYNLLKHNSKIKQEPNKTKPILPPNIQSFEQKLLSGKAFVEYKRFHIS